MFTDLHEGVLAEFADVAHPIALIRNGRYVQPLDVVEDRRARARAYQASEAGKATQRRYATSEKGRASRRARDARYRAKRALL
jgi:hypothetical protein